MALPAPARLGRRTVLPLMLSLPLVIAAASPCAASDRPADANGGEIHAPVRGASVSRNDEANADQLADDLRWQRWLGIAVITAYGTAQWDYFSRAPHNLSEGWFDADTQEGGADKLGHFYLTHVLVQGLHAQYQHWGMDTERAARQAALTSVLWMGAMELGDSFSDYGFAAEDLVMNLAGSYASYLLATHPDWQRRIDFRLEHSLDGFSSDPFTDYQRNKYLLAFKLDGFAFAQDTLLAWLELQLGYYTRGYGIDEANTRTLYVGIGFNVSRWLARQHWPRTARLMNFWQLPYTRINQEHKLDD